MTRTHIPAVTLAVFDLDGTLVDSLPDLADAAREMMARYGLPRPDDDVIRGMIGDGAGVLVERLLAFGGASPEIAPEKAIAEFVALYTPRSSRLTRPFPGTREALDTLRGRGIACAVCTNKPEAPARDILQALGLSDAFVALAGGNTFPWRKPDPRHLLGVIELAGHAPENAVMIGDHHNDLLAAHGAHVRGIFAEWGYGTPGNVSEPVIMAESISRIPAIIAEIPV
ncbi:HAD hydrolase-like protein [Acidomonas methanolica]|uniref:Phosphoglycolate phosphatase n=1 Tax=Acidomonas methanolica NBRC 104435 TaxID=1231351 RepID=A0A023D5F9_ACIMT|nr:HAD hydrolase-like protein [Acidomonas methanolica]MBU2653180.1 HAD hydrolase-like protein [Acidomonas methanolica]TCS32129.1 phosphoglycolate phosphatase [Acidomonas methanolica]GAJ29393.1 phosphoglycolate phosphatase [Acidomonas methanolica NBRC 104435]GBQ51340.1 phosphoglycolate phosphatase [Acidomonas methanolica]GEK97562.1 phosphoglycolate phosphatase [Acidomonas methanolica NBRC 104435]